MDIYFEQNVENPKIDSRKKKYKVLNIVRYVIIVAAAILAYVLFMNIMLSDTKNGWTPIIINAVVSVLIIVPFILAFIFLGKYLNNTNIEYDYVITDGLFRIVKVINRKKRKKMLEFQMSSVESIGKIQSDTYDRYAATKDIKKVFALCNYEDEDRVLYIYFGNDGARQLLHIEPSDEMIMALRRSVSRITIIDKSLKLSIPSSAAIKNSESKNTVSANSVAGNSVIGNSENNEKKTDKKNAIDNNIASDEKGSDNK